MKTTKELADLIRDQVDPDVASKIPAEMQHVHKQAVEVTKELGMEPNAVNVSHVAELIRDHIELEYPKMLYRDQKPEGRHFEEVTLHPHDKDHAVKVYGVLVDTESEEKDLGDGWHESAHKAAGLGKDEQ